MSLRTEQLRSLLRQEISDILRKHVNDPRIGFVTVTDAKITPDLRQARIFVSIMGSEEEKSKAMDALKSAAGFIRSEFGRRVRMKTLPELVFEQDVSIDRGMRIFELLEQIKKEDEGEEGA